MTLKIVPADLPVTEGTERIVEELTTMMTRRMADAYAAGFKLGVEETLRIVRDAGILTPVVQRGIEQLLDNMEEDDDEHTP